MNRTIYTFISVILFLFTSCSLSQKEKANTTYQDWIGKKVLIPQKLIYKTLGKDTICSNIWNETYKIFTYIDSIGCTSCQMNLPEWSAKIQICRQQHVNVEFIFAVHTSDFKRFEEGILASHFEYPIIYDYNNSFESLNKFPPLPYRTFLLDKDNRILLIGSPINSSKTWALYKNTIIQN